MKKKIVLAVFGGIALVGVVLCLVGFAFGGRIANIQVDNDGVYYDTGKERRQIAAGNSWMPEVVEMLESHRAAPFDIERSVEIMEEHVEDYDYDYDHEDNWDDDDDDDGDREYAHGAAVDDTTLKNNTFWAKSMGDLKLSRSEEQIFEPQDEETITHIDMDIDAGYVKVVKGDKLQLKVQGPMGVQMEDGHGSWEISAETEKNRIKTRSSNADGFTHFYQGNEDITTLFTLVVPTGRDSISVDFEMGALNAQGIEAKRLELNTELGSMYVQGCKAEEGEIGTQLGAVTIAGAQLDNCTMKTELGAMDFEGNVTGDMRIDCELGSVKAVLPRPKDFSWEASADLGSVKIDGKSISGLGSEGSGGTDGAKPWFDLNCNLGSIEVQFK